MLLYLGYYTFQASSINHLIFFFLLNGAFRVMKKENNEYYDNNYSSTDKAIRVQYNVHLIHL